MGKAWTDEDNQLLLDLCGKGIPLTKRMELFPNRTYEAVKAHASRIGAEYIGQCPWTPEEDKALRSIYESDESIKAGLHMLPRRSHAAAKARAHRLKLDEKKAVAVKALSWLKPAIQRVLKDGRRMTSVEIASATGGSRSAVQQILAIFHGVEFRIGDWKRTDPCHWTGAWALGKEADVPKPAPVSMAVAHRKWLSKKRIREGEFNPFAVAAGLVAAPSAPAGRMFTQSMSIREDEEVMA